MTKNMYTELVSNRGCKLVVIAVDFGGRWSDEAVQFARVLAQAKARENP